MYWKNLQHLAWTIFPFVEWYYIFSIIKTGFLCLVTSISIVVVKTSLLLNYLMLLIIWKVSSNGLGDPWFCSILYAGLFIWFDIATLPHHCTRIWLLMTFWQVHQLLRELFSTRVLDFKQFYYLSVFILSPLMQAWETDTICNT